MTKLTFVREHKSGVLLEISVVPKASRNQIVGVHDGRLKLQVTAPPSDGAANRAVCQLIAKVAGIPKSRVTVIAGESNRRKTVLLVGVEIDTVYHVLEAQITD